MVVPAPGEAGRVGCRNAEARPTGRVGRSPWSVALCIALLIGCSENFGTAPLGTPGSVAVAVEGFAGPAAVRATTALAGDARRLWLGTDRGSYLADVGRAGPRWRPGSADAAPLPVVAIAGEPTGNVWLLQSRGGSDDLRLSPDGGRTFRFLPNPLAFVSTVERVGALPASAVHAEGAAVAVQGVQLFVWPLGDGEWRQAQLPGTAAEFGPVAGDRGGRVAIAAREGSAWQVWTSQDGALSFARSVADPGGPALALAWREDGQLASATATGVVAGGDTLRLGASRVAWHAALRARGEVVDYALALQGDSLALGQLPGPPPIVSALPFQALPQAGLVVDAGGAWIAAGDATLWRVTPAGATTAATASPFDGGYLDFTTAAADPRIPGGLLLARGLGDTYRGAATSREPTALGKVYVSNALIVLADQGDPSGVFWGAFGAAWHPGTALGVWEARSAGQSSYLQIVFAGPVQVTALAQRPTDPLELWLGAAFGDGVYRSVDGGRNWARVHAGLGVPGAIDGEDGLSGVTEVRAFAFVDDQVWMGGFRGGVHRFDAGMGSWAQSNRGLPRIGTGTPLDSCCTIPLEREVDVRDLAALPGGALLAATGHGLYRDQTRSGNWVASMQGLLNGDVYCLATHPTRPDWVLAGCRGSANAPDFLFLSRDGGRSWAPLASGLAERWAIRVMWTDPDALEAVAVLSSSGAWRMVLAP